MATKSFYKSVVIVDKSACRNLVSALEGAKRKKAQRIAMSKKVSTIKRSQLKEFFSDT